MRAIKTFCFAIVFLITFSSMDFLAADSSQVSIVSASSASAIAWSSPGDDASNHHDVPYKRLLSPFAVSYLQPRWAFAANGNKWGTSTVEGNVAYAADTSRAVWRVGAHARETTWETKFPAYAGGSGSFYRVTPTHIDSDPHHSPIMVGAGGNACDGS